MMWLLVYCPSSFSSQPQFHPVPHEVSHTGVWTLQPMHPSSEYPSCKQLPLGYSSNLGMCVVAAPLGEWVRGEVHSCSLEVDLGQFGQGVLGYQVPRVWA